MSSLMDDDEFQNCFTIDRKKIQKIEDELESKGINDIKSQIEYVKEHYYGQLYMNFSLKKLDDMILRSYHETIEEFIISKNSVDGMLRAFFFATELLQARLPQHAYDYMASKSSTFFYELLRQFPKQKE